MRQSQYKSYPGLTKGIAFNNEQELRSLGGVPINTPVFKDGLLEFSSGDSQKVTFEAQKEVQSIRLKVKDVTTFYLKLSATRSIQVVGGVLSAIGFTSPTYYVDGAIGTSIGTDLVITDTVKFDCDDIQLGYNGSTYGTFKIDFKEYYNRILTSSEIHNLYHGLDNVELPLVKNFKGWLRCTASGKTYQESTQAYGVWEFDINKKGTGPVFRFTSMNSTGGAGYAGHFIQLYSNRALFLYREGLNLFQTAASYIDNDTEYRIKVERNETLNQYHTGAIGSFAVYIKGGTFGDTYVLVDVTGGAGANPVVDNTYTTSAYSVVDIDTGDKIRNIQLTSGELKVEDFTEGTGAYIIDPAYQEKTLLDFDSTRGVIKIYTNE